MNSITMPTSWDTMAINFNKNSERNDRSDRLSRLSGRQTACIERKPQGGTQKGAEWYLHCSLNSVAAQTRPQDRHQRSTRRQAKTQRHNLERQPCADRCRQFHIAQTKSLAMP